jgi:transketolase C-terminal domain/subunit
MNDHDEELTLEEKGEAVQEALETAIALAKKYDLVARIDIKSLKPLAMGNVEMVPVVYLGNSHFR